MKHQASVIGVVVALGSSPVIAQETPQAEIGIGYAYLNSTYQNYPLGGFADVAFPIHHWLGMVGEVALNYHTHEEVWNNQHFEVKRDRQTFLVGPRFARRGQGATLHFQVLAGAVRDKVATSSFPEGGWSTVGGLQPGLALEARLSHALAARIGGDALLIFAEGGGDTEWRATAGLVYRFTRR